MTNNKPPNFEKEGKFYLIRCFACSDSPRGRENWLPAAATGECSWCGAGKDGVREQTSDDREA